MTTESMRREAYQAYLKTDPCPYIANEEDFIDDMSDDEKMTKIEKVYREAMNQFQDWLPEDKKKAAIIIRLGVTALRNSIATHPKIVITVTGVMSVWLTVFFYPQLLPSMPEFLFPSFISTSFTTHIYNKMRSASSTGGAISE